MAKASKPEPKKAGPAAETAPKGSNDSNLFAAISEFFGGTIVVPVLLYLIKKEDSFVKFHSIQALILGAIYCVVLVGLIMASFVLSFAGGIGALLSCITLPLALAYLLLVLVLTWKAYSGEKYALPLIGNFAEQYSK